MNKQVIILSLFIFIILMVIPFATAQSCCIAPFSSTASPTGGIYPLSSSATYVSNAAGQLACNNDVGPGLLFVDDCIVANAIKPEVSDTGCCCDSYNNIQDFGASSSSIPAYSIYELYCSDQGGTPTAKNSANQCVCTPGTPTTIMHEVTGTVRLNSATGPLLQGITVQAENGFLINDVTDSFGLYDLGNIPGIDNGQNLFTATAPTNYIAFVDFNGDGTQTTTQLVCQQTTETRTFSGSYATTETVNFVMQCQEAGTACTPDWTTADWGPCVPYGGEYVKLRQVTDANSCNVLTGKPISVLTQSTPAPDSADYDCPLVNFGSVCGDGQVTGYEQCDVDTLGVTQYKQIPDGTISPSLISCSSVGLGGNGASLGCTVDCGYDYSACIDTCAICDSASKCGTCSSCIGSPLCEISCDELVPEFLDGFTPSSSTNVLDSYDPSQTYLTGVFYTAGTNDVTLKWVYTPSQTCLNDLYGYKVYMCEDSGQNTCLPQTTTTFSVQPTTQQTTLTDVLEPQTTYCYNLCTVTQDGEEHCVYDDGADLPCFSSGDSYCQEVGSEALTCSFDDVTLKQQPTGCYTEVIQNQVFTNLSFSVVEPLCTGNEQCVQTPYVANDPLQQGAKCVTKGSCESCNGFFGLYANYDLSSTVDTLPVAQCSLFEFDQSVPLQTPATNYFTGLCYLDKQDTFLDTYSSCDAVTTCYDYSSQRTCEKDPCFKFTNLTNPTQPLNGCEWNEYAGELGLGVCSPVEEKNQDCLLCDTDSPTGICDENMCGLYGNCYFKEQQYHNITSLPQEEMLFSTPPNTLNLLRHTTGPFLSTCLPKKDLTCFFYENENDCTGGTPSSVDKTYGIVNGENITVSGNNTLTPSQDLYGLGTCKWINDTTLYQDVGCFKDSDDIITIPGPPFKNLSDDCFDYTLDQQFFTASQDQVDCLYDHTAPTTTFTPRTLSNESIYFSTTTNEQLPVYGLAELDELSFVATDETWSSDRLTTHLALVPKSCAAPSIECYPTSSLSPNTPTQCANLGCPVYPIHTLDEYVDPADPLNVTNFTDGEYAALFYTSDPAKNLEVVQTQYIYIDTTGPTLTSPLVTDIDTFAVAEDIYRSNITISFGISENAFCEGKLYRTISSTDEVAGQSIANYGNTFTAKYVFIEDGTYLFNYTCYDDYGNDLVDDELITIEANPSITNPTPQGLIYPSLLQVPDLSIDTATSATCKFDTENRPYTTSRANFQNSGNGLEHTYPISVSQPANLGFTQVSSHYFVYTSCSFANGDVTEQIVGDVITFTVDAVGPVVDVSTRATNTQPWTAFSLADTEWAPQRELQLTCDDYNDLIPIHQFGCKKIQYCFAPAQDLETFTSTNCQSSLQTINSAQTTLQLDYLSAANLQLYYRGIDKGLNEGDWQRINPKVRDIVFTDPQIYFVN